MDLVSIDIPEIPDGFTKSEVLFGPPQFRKLAHIQSNTELVEDVTRNCDFDHSPGKQAECKVLLSLKLIKINSIEHKFE